MTVRRVSVPGSLAVVSLAATDKEQSCDFREFALLRKRLRCEHLVAIQEACINVAAHEIRVQVRQDHVLDRQPILRGEGGVLIRVALRINDDGRARLLVSDEIRRMRQARQIKLLEDHRSPSQFPDRYFGCGTIRR